MKPDLIRTFFLPLGICLILTLASGLAAQEDLPVEEIEVVKQFEARLIETRKPDFNPGPIRIDSTERKYQYTLSQVRPQIRYEPPVIRPLALRAEVQPTLYNGFVRVGYGFPNAWIGDLSYRYHGEGPFEFAFTGYHESANLKKEALKQYSESGGKLEGAIEIMPAVNLNANLGYDVDKVYFYGVDPDDLTDYVDPDRRLRTLTVGGGLKNTAPLRGDIDYDADLQFYELKDNLGPKESGMQIGLSGVKRFEGKHVLSLDLGADISKLKDISGARNLNAYSALPAFAFHGYQYALKAGVNVAGSAGEFGLFPVIAVDVRIARNQFGVFAEVDGGFTKNNFRALSSYNPFISQEVDSLASTLHRDYAIGIRGTFRRISYEGRAALTSFKSLALYEQDFYDYRKYQPVYDDGTLYRFEGVFGYRFTEQIKATGTISKIFYDLDNEEKPWHLPTFYASLLVTHNTLDQKFHVSGGIQYQAGVHAMTEFNEIDRLKGFLDLSFSAEYYFLEHLGAFVHLNNLLGRKAERWRGYETYGVNGVFGIMMRI